MKKTLIFFSNSEIHSHNIADAKSVDERRNIFRIIYYILSLEICIFSYYLMG